MICLKQGILSNRTKNNVRDRKDPAGTGKPFLKLKLRAIATKRKLTTKTHSRYYYLLSYFFYKKIVICFGSFFNMYLQRHYDHNPSIHSILA